MYTILGGFYVMGYSVCKIASKMKISNVILLHWSPQIVPTDSHTTVLTNHVYLLNIISMESKIFP